MKTVRNALYLGVIVSMALSFAPKAFADSNAHKDMEQHSQKSAEHEATMDQNVVADDAQMQDLKWLDRAESKYICMVNNTRFDNVQIPTEVDGKTYYGCCPMCKAKLEKSQELREAIDPVSENIVDKATAVIATGPDGAAYYFENEENMKKFDASQSSDEPSHNNHDH